jgi:hypothetical protein
LNVEGATPLGNSTPDTQTIILTVPPKATTVDTTWVVKPTVNAEAISSGYPTIQITATNTATGVETKNFVIPLELHMAKPATDGIPSFSTDGGQTWTQMTRVLTKSLPANLQEGYFVNDDGSITFLTRHLTEFGIRKPTQQIAVATDTAILQLGETTFLVVTGGTGTGKIAYHTSTPLTCAVSDTGFVVALAAGDCLVSATKFASDIYLDTSATPLKITISDSDAKAAAAAAAAQAQQEALVRANAAAAAAAAGNLKIWTGARIKGYTPVRVNLGAVYAGQSVIVAIQTKVKGKVKSTDIGGVILSAKGFGVFTTKVVIPKTALLTVRLAPVIIAQTQQATPRPTPTPTKKPVVKKPVVKKPVVKKVTPKPVVKKPVVKKATPKASASKTTSI